MQPITGLCPLTDLNSSLDNNNNCNINTINNSNNDNYNNRKNNIHNNPRLTPNNNLPNWDSLSTLINSHWSNPASNSLFLHQILMFAMSSLIMPVLVLILMPAGDTLLFRFWLAFSAYVVTKTVFVSSALSSILSVCWLCYSASTSLVLTKNVWCKNLLLFILYF